MWLADRVGSGVPNRASPEDRGGLYQGGPIDEVSRSHPGYLLAIHASLQNPRPQVGAAGIRLRANHAQLGRPSRGCSATIRDGRSVHGALRRPYMGRRPGGTAALGENSWQEFIAARSSEPCELIARCHTPNCPLWLRPPHFISSRRWKRRFTPPSAISARRGTLQQSDAKLRGARPGSAWKPNGSSGFPSQNIGRARVVGALLPILGEWASRGYGRLTFRLTQVITGVGCFGITCVASGGRRRRGATVAARATRTRRITLWHVAESGTMTAGSSRRGWAPTSTFRLSCVGWREIGAAGWPCPSSPSRSCSTRKRRRGAEYGKGTRPVFWPPGGGERGERGIDDPEPGGIVRRRN